jgi:GT2 family glycosyltransferase
MNRDQPTVYCIVLNLNGRDLLAETLESMGKMNYPSAKIVVVDNGSNDRSQSMVRERFPGIDLIENGSNLGFGGGNNVGMQFALDRGAEWIILLNNDIAVDPAMLDELMTIALSDSSIGALSPKIYYFGEPDKLWYAGGSVNFWTGVISHRGLRETDHGDYDRIEDTEYITGCALLVRGSVLKKVGLFDPVYRPIYTEDADLSLRIRRAGYRLVYVPPAKLWHKVSAFSGGGLTPFKTRLKVEHNLIFFKRYARWYHWLTIPWCIGGMTVIFVVKELVKGNFSILAALVKGFAAAIKRIFSR